MVATGSSFDRYLYYAFIPVLLIFLSYVGLGYFLSITTEYPSLNAWLAAAICLGITLLIFFIIKSAAFEFNHASHKGGVAYAQPAAMFVLLLFISAYGFLSSSILLFEGPFIAQEQIGRAVGTLGRLKSVAPQLLAVREVEALEGRVKANEAQLMREIDNPSMGSFCGVGPSAKATIARLKEDLPQIDVFAGTDRNHDCRDKAFLRRLQETYGGAIKAALNEHPLRKQYRADERQDFIGRARKTVDRDVAQLGGVSNRLSTMTSFLFNPAVFTASANALDHARGDYASLYNELSGLVGGDPSASDLPREIETTPLAKISSGLHVFDTILSRLDRTSVRLLILIAILSDALATFITFRAIRYQAQLDIEHRNALEALKLAKSGLTYLWRPRLHPLARS